ANPARDPELLREGLEPGTGGTVADDGQGERGRIGGHGTDQGVETVPIAHEADEAERGRAYAGARRGWVRAVEDDAVRDDVDAGEVDALVLQHGAEDAGDREDVGGAAPDLALERVGDGAEFQAAEFGALGGEG